MKNMWVKKVIAAAVTLTMLTTSASTLSVMADAESTTETEAAVDSAATVDGVATVDSASTGCTGSTAGGCTDE